MMPTFPRLQYWPASAGYFLGPNARDVGRELHTVPIPAELGGDLPGTSAYPMIEAGQAPQFGEAGAYAPEVLWWEPDAYVTPQPGVGPYFSRLRGYLEAGQAAMLELAPAPTRTATIEVPGMVITPKPGPGESGPGAGDPDELPPPTTIPKVEDKPKAVPWGWILGSGFAVLALGGVIYFATAKRRRRNPRRRRRQRARRRRARRRSNPTAVQRGLAQTRREIERDQRAAARRELERLRADVKRARKQKRETLAAIRAECAELRQRQKVASAKARARVSAKARDAKASVKRGCADARAGARELGNNTIESAKAKLQRERSEQKWLRARAKSKTKTPALRRAERRAESDDEVRRNVPRELHGVWERVKRRISGSGRRSRTEAFLEWVEENPDEVIAIQSEQADADVDAMIADYMRQANPRRRRRNPRWAVDKNDPTYKKAIRAIERVEALIRKHARGEPYNLDQMNRAFDRAHYLARFLDDEGQARADALSGKLLRARTEYDRVRAARRKAEIEKLRGEMRGPGPGTWEHELALMRGKR